MVSFSNHSGQGGIARTQRKRGKGCGGQSAYGPPPKKDASPIAGVSSRLIDEARTICFGSPRPPKGNAELDRFLTTLEDVKAKHQKK